MHFATCHAGYCLERVAALVIVFNVPLHIQACMLAAKNESRHELSLGKDHTAR